MLTMAGLDPTQTRIARARYERIAPLYDVMEVLAERRFDPWRRRLWDDVQTNMPPGGRILEVGVGTGKNMSYWPRGVEITAVDLTPGMLHRAKARLGALSLRAKLELGDAQALRYPAGYFDMAVATFVFCSVPDPVLGLRELRRVLRPGGAVLLLEHVRSSIPWLGRLMDILNPVVVRLVGANLNRDTVGNVRRAGLEIDRVEDLSAGGIFKLIEAHSVEANGAA